MWEPLTDYAARDVTVQNWILAWFLICAAILIPLFPFILRRRRKRERAELHDKIAKAKSEILADGVVEGPKGPYVPHKRWGVGAQAGHDPLTDHESNPVAKKGYYGSA